MCLRLAHRAGRRPDKYLYSTQITPEHITDAPGSYVRGGRLDVQYMRLGMVYAFMDRVRFPWTRVKLKIENIRGPSLVCNSF